MSISASLCSTCLSTLDEGAKLTDPLTNFLCDVLHFKPQLLHGSQNIICRKCYNTLIELKCFYNQLRDVEVYFESKSDVIINCDDNEIEENETENEEDEEAPYIGDMECTVSIADESKLDPIVIDEDEDCCIVENDIDLKKPKTSDISSGKRFVCLTCSKLFRSVDDLRSHEKTHSLPSPIQKASPVFVQAASQVSQNVTCQECGKDFHNKVILATHMRKHHTLQNKSIHLFCCVCKEKFPNKELLLKHQGRHECWECPEISCSETVIEDHMRKIHNWVPPTVIPHIQHFLTELPRRRGKLVRKRCVLCYQKLKKNGEAAALKTKQVHTECKQCSKAFCLACFNNYHKNINK